MAGLTKVVKIDDVEFEITQLGGVEGLEMFDRFTKELGPALSGAIRAGIGATNAEARIAFLVIEAMATLPADFKKELWTTFAGLSKVKAGSIMLALGDGKRLEVGGAYDQHFAGRFGHMSRWLLACLKWSFGDFLPSSAESGEVPAAPTR